MTPAHNTVCAPADVARFGPFPKSLPQHLIDPLDFTLQPGGRWERLLRTLSENVLPTGQLVRATNPGVRTHKSERMRVSRSLQNMARLGLVENVPGWGWTATPRGRAELDTLTFTPGGDIAHV